MEPLLDRMFDIRPDRKAAFFQVVTLCSTNAQSDGRFGRRRVARYMQLKGYKEVAIASGLFRKEQRQRSQIGKSTSSVALLGRSRL